MNSFISTIYIIPIVQRDDKICNFCAAIFKKSALVERRGASSDAIEAIFGWLYNHKVINI